MYPKFSFVTKLYIFRASSVPIIRNYQLHTWQLVCFIQVVAAGEESQVGTAWNIKIATCTADNSWWWAQKMPKTCRVSWQNKILDTCFFLFIYTKVKIMLDYDRSFLVSSFVEVVCCNVIMSHLTLFKDRCFLCGAIFVWCMWITTKRRSMWQDAKPKENVTRDIQA
jgi:hypothetical protein